MCVDCQFLNTKSIALVVVIEALNFDSILTDVYSTAYKDFKFHT